MQATAPLTERRVSQQGGKTMKRSQYDTLRISCCLTLAMGASPSAFSQAVQYSLTERAALSGHSLPAVTSINASGQAVGSDFDVNGTEHPVFWQEAQPQALPEPNGFFGGRGTGINKFGQPVGIMFDINSDEHAFKWSPTLTGPTELTPPSNNTSAPPTFPKAINDLGEVVGYSSDKDDDDAHHAVTWTGTVAKFLPFYPFGMPLLTYDNEALGINAAGVVVGTINGLFTNGSEVGHAVVWNGTSLTVLPDSGIGYNRAVSVNDSGWIAGDSSTEPIPGVAQVLTHAALWKGTVATDLGSLTGANGYSYAAGINSSGQIVGQSDSADGLITQGLGHAVLWQNGQMIDLNDATKSSRPNNVVLQSANAIADNGEIDVVAFNTSSQVYTDYLLTPHYVTTTSLVSTTHAPIYNQSIKLVATVRASLGGTVTGVVTFRDSPGLLTKGRSRRLGTATLNSAGQASITTTLAAGTRMLTAEYGGSAKDLPSTSPVLREQVARARSTTTLSSSINPASFGQTVNLTATIHPADGGPATGSVIFRAPTGIIAIAIGTVPVGANGKAVLSTHSLQPGAHQIVAVYQGDSNVMSSMSSVLTEKVSQVSTQTDLTSSPNPSTHNHAVAFTATVKPAFAGTVTGTVSFKDGNTIVGQASVNGATGKAQLSTSALTVGTHSISAVYNGNSTDKASTSTVLHQVVQ